MRRRLTVGAGIAVVGIAVLTAVLLKLPTAEAIVFAPALVIGSGLVAGIVIVLGRAALESARRVRRPRLVLALWVLGLALVALFSILGVELPRE